MVPQDSAASFVEGEYLRSPIKFVNYRVERRNEMEMSIKLITKEGIIKKQREREKERERQITEGN